MRDRQLEKNIGRVEGFVEEWKQLSLFLERGFHGAEFADEDEAAFLELKSRIAQDHETMVTTLGKDVEHDDRALRLLNSVPSLHSFGDLPEGMAKKIASEWHSTYLSLQALLGRLKGRQIQLSSISSMGDALRRFYVHPVVVVVLLIAAGYGIYSFVQELRPELEKYYGRSDHDQTRSGGADQQ